MGFNYRNALGEALFAMITCRPDILFPIIKLSKFVNNLAQVNYQALKNVLSYLRETMDDGLIYWRSISTKISCLYYPVYLKHSTKNMISQITHLPNYKVVLTATRLPMLKLENPLRTYYSISLAQPFTTKRIFKIIFHIAPQKAEFIAACDAGKAALYLQSIFDDIGVPQHEATVILEDNTGALMMANAKQPTRRTKHMDVRHFALQD